MTATPRRYQFDNHLPVSHDPGPLPVYRPEPLTPEQYAQPQPPQVVNIYQAPPDRTIQRVALGSGMGAGAVAAGVYFGPLLVAAMTSMAISLAVVAVVVTASAWAVVTVVRSIGGAEGKAAAQNVRRGRRRR